ncbi:putative nicotinate-nucleotide adenylyltransferase [Shouchella clausii]|uniref:nicotinate-nucleotide adenylyltransferase n=1 Tax=Shouchella tritolerans TaxID=2979466 RepID=UPI000787E10C|nr:nicotinate-nucleotide adenylyltransferase [Shouchella tritolerans]GIN10552.1 putative nicotinate-nucleotide adenylyltransferase [Shouchella clausii]
MKRIGLFGGTFDPPHLGHLLIAQEALTTIKLDEVWFVPVSTPPHKDRTGLTSGKDRYDMVKAALLQEGRFRVCDIELIRKGKSYTIDTVRELKRTYPNDEFFFLIGGDMVDMLPEWRGIDELKQLVTFVAFNRPGASVKSRPDVHFVPFVEVNISSSLIRERLAKGKPIRYFVTPEVEQLIEERNLYGDNNE